jgi:hypothetical protein
MLALEVISSGNEELSTLYRSQLVAFASRSGRFSRNAARIDALNPTMSVLNWWRFYGGDTPELRALAIKVLSQPISTSSAERVWSTYSYIHNVKRNRLNEDRADTLVYIHSNLRLIDRYN